MPGCVDLGGYGLHGSSLRDLPRLRDGARRRDSSWDRTGGNEDWIIVPPGETSLLLDAEGAGNVNHIWIGIPDARAIARSSPRAATGTSCSTSSWRCTGTARTSPSVLVPLGAFFGGTHVEPAEFSSAPIQVGPRDGRSLTSFFHMPFASGARIGITNESPEPMRLWYYVDYERFDHLEPEIARFHATWNRGRFEGEPEEGSTNEEYLFGGRNLTGEDNFVLLSAEGRGVYVGCFLSVHNLRRTHEWNWYGEGDDMIFIDGAELASGPPRHRARGLLRLHQLPAGRARHPVARADPRRRRELERPLHLLPLPHRGSRAVQGVDRRLDRARAREQAP